jgi:hypothetical protein
MEANVYLDESGDLGWTFSRLYRRGGSSRYLTIAYIIIPRESHHLLGRLVRDCYNRWGIDPKKEMKGNLMSYARKMDIVKAAIKLLGKEPRAHLGAITVKKENVDDHIRKDPNKLYNYMMGLALLDQIKAYDHVQLIRDNRSIKVEDGNSIGYYLQMQLWFALDVHTHLKDEPTDSKVSTHLQFVDWISYIVWSAFEDRHLDHYRLLSPYGTFKQLFHNKHPARRVSA